ncbi:MAG: ABC transporter permease, partial [Phycisphaerales bacterium]|nr:ABC transporter permease [Phycisphaerales bacterium]
MHIQGPRAGLSSITFPDFVEIRKQGTSFESMAAWQGWSVTLRDPDGTPSARASASVSGNFFDILGGRPVLGRFFNAEEDRLGHAPVVVVSYELWWRDFGGRPNIVGETINSDGTPYTIIGVTPQGFVDPVGAVTFRTRPQLWRSRPPAFDETTAAPNWFGFWGIARLTPGMSLDAAQTEVNLIMSRLWPNRRYDLTTLKNETVSGARTTLLVLAGAVVTLLLIACANVANLLLTRAAGRSREIAIRAALGASRGRLIRQLLVESLTLSLAGGMLGVLIAAFASDELVALAGRSLPRVEEIGMDPTAVVFSGVVSVLTAVVFGIAPAIQVTQRRFAESLQEGGRSVSGLRGERLRKTFVVAEMSMAVVLLISAGLLIKSFWKLQNVDAGFDYSSVLTVTAGFPTNRFTADDDAASAIAQVGERLSQLPGITLVGAISDLPLSG